MTTGNHIADPSNTQHPGNPRARLPAPKGYRTCFAEWDSWEVEVEYEDLGSSVKLYAVWCGPWNVLPLLTNEQHAHIEHAVQEQAWDL